MVRKRRHLVGYQQKQAPCALGQVLRYLDLGAIADTVQSQ
jgi:hypothetical protein